MAVNSKQQATKPVVLNPIDVIILNLMTPGVKGFDVVQQLRAHSKDMDIPNSPSAPDLHRQSSNARRST